MKKILIINPGSTSTKYKIFNQKGLVLDQRNYKISERKEEQEFLHSLDGIEKIGVRVVHGGDISECSKITKKLKNKIAACVDFAPIHNARAIELIEKMDLFFPNTSQYAVFDTAFHTSIPEHLSTYAIPSKLAKKHKIKKYGFHGIAVQSALTEFKKIRKAEAKKYPKNIVCAHLGGGNSITAIKNGKSLSTSMGLTPISGIMMATRVGDADSDLDKILAKKEGKTIDEISHILSFESGFKGLTGTTDTLKIFEAAKKGSKKEKLAYDMFLAEIVEKIWGYAGLMQGIEALVFSGGIGFGNKQLRKDIARKILKLGIQNSDIYAVDVDEEKVIFDNIRLL